MYSTIYYDFNIWCHLSNLIWGVIICWTVLYYRRGLDVLYNCRQLPTAMGQIFRLIKCRYFALIYCNEPTSCNFSPPSAKLPLQCKVVFSCSLSTNVMVVFGGVYSVPPANRTIFYDVSALQYNYEKHFWFGKIWY